MAVDLIEALQDTPEEYRAIHLLMSCGNVASML